MGKGTHCEHPSTLHMYQETIIAKQRIELPTAKVVNDCTSAAGQHNLFAQHLSQSKSNVKMGHDHMCNERVTSTVCFTCDFISPLHAVHAHESNFGDLSIREMPGQVLMTSDLRVCKGLHA